MWSHNCPSQSLTGLPREIMFVFQEVVYRQLIFPRWMQKLFLKIQPQMKIAGCFLGSYIA